MAALWLWPLHKWNPLSLLTTHLQKPHLFTSKSTDSISAMNPIFPMTGTSLRSMPPPVFKTETGAVRSSPPPGFGSETGAIRSLPPPGFEAGTSGRSTPPPGSGGQTGALVVMPPPGLGGETGIVRSLSLGKKGANFYKLVTSSMLEERHLKIPGSFVHELQDPCVHLSLANGHYWTVKLLKENNKAWFVDGWHEYLQVLSIRVGFFLFFRYEGNSKFDVSVYSINGLEKLPCTAASSSAGSGHHASCSTSRARCSCVTPSYLGNEAFGDFAEQKPFSSSQNWPSFGNMASAHLPSIASSSHGPMPYIAMNENTRRWRPVTVEEKRMALQASQMYNSANPFFKVTLKQSYSYKGYSLHIPAKFAKTHLQGVSEIITLVHDRKQWIVTLWSGGGANRLTKGWNKFSTENYLEEDDVCVFDLIRTPHIVFAVTIFRVLELRRPILQITNS